MTAGDNVPMTALLRSAVLLAWLALAACGPDVPPAPVVKTGSISRSLTDPAEMQAFKDALTAAKVPYEVVRQDDGLEYAKYDLAYEAAGEAISDKLFGKPLPNGRHLGHSSDFEDWLRANGIPFATQLRRGHTYIVWADADSARVKAYPRFPPQFK